MSQATVPRTLALNDDQIATFDTEDVTPSMWSAVLDHLRSDFPEGRFRFVDLGGGNGLFADRILEAFPESSGVVYDRARLLLDRNRVNRRKRIVEGSIEDSGRVLTGERFEVVFFNWVLHHLVTGTWRGTESAQARALADASGLLSPGGRVSVIENFYEGIVFSDLPGRLIFAATSSKLLAPVTRRLGANTAGVGVAFRSRADWRRVLARVGLHSESPFEDFIWRTSFAKRALLHIAQVRAGHLWCRPDSEYRSART